MNFVQPAFAVLMSATFIAHWTVSGPRAKNAILVAASAVFYGWLHPWMVLLLLASALLDYLAALGIETWRARARTFLAISVAGNLGLLALFKYLDWLSESVGAALDQLGLGLSPPVLGLALPLGISFYTFQTLGYTIDVYRGDLRARRDLVDYLAFVMFFPQLVAGPIERARNLLPQLERDRHLDWTRVRSGLSLALWGAFTKVVVADTLAPYVDAVFSLEQPPGVLLWTAATAFGIQLYADFQGYTSLARGTARMLGIELVPNFDQPFLATTTPEFWRRWHMSMSSWLRDYCLVPLLGPGRTFGRARTAAALLVTFVLIGIWHGAGWHYAVFGLWHAAWVLLFLEAARHLPRGSALPSWARVPAAGLHIALVLTPGAFLFREPDVARGLAHIVTPPWQGSQDAYVVATVLGATTAALGSTLFLEWILRRALGASLWSRIGTASEPLWVMPTQTSAWSLCLLSLLVFHPVTSRDFIYFQF